MEKNLLKAADVASANNLGRKLQIVIVIVLTVSHLVQAMHQSITSVGLSAALFFLWVPVILTFVIYHKKPESLAIRHVIGVGYGMFYIVACFVSSQQLAFIYAFPMMIVVTIFCDYAFSILVSSAVLVIAIVHAIVFTAHNGFTPYNLEAMEIEIAASLFVSAYCLISNKFVIDINRRHIKEAEESTSKTENVLEEVMKVSNDLVDEVQLISSKMDVLSASSNETLTAMTDVQGSSAETADSVQKQLLMTEEIQNQITQVTSAAESIGDSVNDSSMAIEDGNKNVKQLIENSSQSEAAGNKAIEQVEALKDFTEQMGNIVALIQSVAVRTNLLSLNASIEAARAGEAGRGFAVVANEISNLAAQTQSATAEINELIDNVSSEMKNVTDAIAILFESNKVQAKSARETAGSFEKITESTKTIRDNSESLSYIVSLLDNANKEIVNNIQTVSAITEEVSAHSAETCEKTEDNERIVREVQAIVREMTINAGKLKEL